MTLGIIHVNKMNNFFIQLNNMNNRETWSVIPSSRGFLRRSRGELSMLGCAANTSPKIGHIGRDMKTP